MKKIYKVFAALHDESNAGWIWMPPENGFTSRDLITITSLTKKKKVYCDCRIIDDNFQSYYKKETGNSIDNKYNTIVISDYYRNKLGGLNTEEEYEFEIVRGKCFVSKIRTLLQHPDNIVKIATWLAIISIGIGLLSILSSILSLHSD